MVQRDRRGNKNKPAKLMGRKRLTEYDMIVSRSVLKSGRIGIPLARIIHRTDAHPVGKCPGSNPVPAIVFPYLAITDVTD